MSHHQASFEIASTSDSYAARRILERVYDTVREESQLVGEGTDDDGLAPFRALRDAAKPPAPGKLTITFERYDDADFEE